MPRQADPLTRERLVSAAIGLALEKGFADSSVDAVCAGAGLTKGAFFHYFKSKQALGQAELETWTARGMSAYGDAPFWLLPDPLERLYGYVDFTVDLTNRGPLGCLVGIFSQELWHSYPALRSSCEQSFTDWADGLAVLIAQAKDHYAPDADFEPTSIARHFIAAFEGGLILARAFEQPAMVEEQLTHFKRYVSHLLSVERAPGIPLQK